MAIPKEMIDQAQSVFKPKMGKYAFSYDWYKNPTIFGITAGSGSNDAFSFSKGETLRLPLNSVSRRLYSLYMASLAHQ
jgi:hypothetical protein